MVLVRELGDAMKDAGLSDSALPHQSDDGRYGRRGREPKDLLSGRGEFGSPASEEAWILHIANEIVRIRTPSAIHRSSPAERITTQTAQSTRESWTRHSARERSDIPVSQGRGATRREPAKVRLRRCP